MKSNNFSLISVIYKMMAIFFAWFLSTLGSIENVSASPIGTFPRIVMPTGSERNLTTPEQVARYDLMLDVSLFWKLGEKNLALVRKINPSFIGLTVEGSSYIHDTNGMLRSRAFKESYLVHYAPPDFSIPPCDSSLRVTFPKNPRVFMWNQADADAVRARSDFIIEQYTQTKKSFPNRYDGIFVDGAHATPPHYIFFKGAAFDLDCDGVKDTSTDQDLITQLWYPNSINFLQNIRDGLPDITLIANDIPVTTKFLDEAKNILNGYNSELQLASFLDGDPIDWASRIYNPLKSWSYLGFSPPTSILLGLDSYTVQFTTPEELAVSQKNYRRMRFGLATALMTGSHYVYTDRENYISTWWYDEYDNAGTQTTGYLGLPVRASYLIDTNSLTTPDLLLNSSFETPNSGGGCTIAPNTNLENWCMNDASKKAEFIQDCTDTPDGSWFGSCSLQVKTNAVAPSASGALQVLQTGVPVQGGHTYTISFWAKAEQPRSIYLQITGDPSVNWAVLSEIITAELTTDWKRYSFTMHVNSIAPADPNHISLRIKLGSDISTVWFDVIRLREGEIGVYKREFENGVALVNTTDFQKTIDLGGTYYHIRGKQDKIVNNGEATNTVNLAPKDGVILLKHPTP